MPEYSSLQKDYAKYRIERAREDLDAAVCFMMQAITGLRIIEPTTLYFMP